MNRNPTSAIRRPLADLAARWLAGEAVAGVGLEAGVAAELGRLAAAHDLVGTLGPLLPEGALPGSVSVSAARRRTCDLLLECERLLPVLTDAGIAPVLLKGAALAQTHYRRPEDRWFLDLDLLVTRDQVAAACSALQDLGYRDLPGGPAPEVYERHHFHRILLGPQGGCVEIHWALTLPGSPYVLDTDRLRSRALTARLGQTPVLVPSSIDQVLHAVYQGIADGHCDLRRVFDLALLMESLTAEETSRMHAEAAAAGMARGLYVSLHNMKSILAGWSEGDGLDAFGPGARRILAGLDPVAACLERRAERQPAYRTLMHLLCLPDAARSRQELGRTFGWAHLSESGADMQSSSWRDSLASARRVAAVAGVALSAFLRF